MVQNCLGIDLINIYENLIINGLNVELAKDIEKYLIYFLDNNTNENQLLLYNLLNILKRQQNTSILLNFLIQEVELKLLRLSFSNNDIKNNKDCYNISSCQKNESKEELKKILKVTNKDLFPPKGTTTRIINKRKEENEEHEYVLEIDDQGNVLEILEHYITKNDADSIDILNDSPLSKLKEKYLKEDKENNSLTENDLE